MYIFVVLFDRPDHRTFRTANGVVCFNPMGRGGGYNRRSVVRPKLPNTYFAAQLEVV